MERQHIQGKSEAAGEGGREGEKTGWGWVKGCLVMGDGWVRRGEGEVGEERERGKFPRPVLDPGGIVRL